MKPDIYTLSDLTSSFCSDGDEYLGSYLTRDKRALIFVSRGFGETWMGRGMARRRPAVIQEVGIGVCLVRSRYYRCKFAQSRTISL